MDPANNPLFQRAQSFPIFSGIDTDSLSTLLMEAELLHFKAGEKIIEEGQHADAFYLLLSGEAKITKKDQNDDHQHCIATCYSGDIAGELVFFENKSRVATVTAVQAVSCLRFNISNLKMNLTSLNQLTVNAGKTVTERLRYTNKVSAKHMREIIDHDKKRIASGRFMVTVFFLMSLYALLLRLIADYSKTYNSTPISTAILIVFATFFYITIKHSGYPLGKYGISTRYTKSQLIETLLYSSAFILIFTFAKAIMMGYLPKYASAEHFQIFEVLLQPADQQLFYFFMMLLYMLVVPLQEFVARACFQGSLMLFLSEKTKNKYIVILLANFLFVSSHAHLTLDIILVTFMPGLLWGYLFYKHKSIISAIISHLMIGVYGIFILGAPGI